MCRDSSNNVVETLGSIGEKEKIAFKIAEKTSVEFRYAPLLVTTDVVNSKRIGMERTSSSRRNNSLNSRSKRKIPKRNRIHYKSGRLSLINNISPCVGTISGSADKYA